MGATPTAAEQALLQYINRARSNPEQEMRDLFNTNSAFVNGSIDAFGANEAVAVSQVKGMSARAPVAWNTSLALSAADHNNLMVVFDEQSHNLPGEPGLIARMGNRGFDFSQGGAAGENVYAYSQNVLHAHAGFYIDWGFGPNGIQEPPGHRNVILSTQYDQVGLSLRSVPASKSIGPLSVTQHFATGSAESGPFIVGVVIDDKDNDDFYDVNEGIGGVKVTATGAGGTFSTTTWSSGGYSLKVAPGSNYTVTFSGKGVDDTSRIKVGNQNVAVDAEKGVVVQNPTPVDPTPQPSTPTGSGSTTPVDSTKSTPVASGLTGTPVADAINGTNSADAINARGGNDLVSSGGGADTVKAGNGDDRVVGGDGADLIEGGEGNDWIAGQRGPDALFGENGNDFVRGGAGRDQVFGGDGNDVLNGHDGPDQLSGDNGNDMLMGDNGNDRLSGGLGNDTLKGGTGNDVMTGDGGADFFFIEHDQSASNRNTDVITDLDFTEDVLVIEAFAGNGPREINSMQELATLSMSGLSMRKVGAGTELSFSESGTSHRVILEGIDIF